MAKRKNKPGIAVPSRIEVEKANASGCRAREGLARKYGLSGSAAAALGLGDSCGMEKWRREQPTRKPGRRRR